MANILYLDVDDEITTAAARIRGSADPRVVLVVPPGSRLATSRMNFRLLAREALEHNRGLSIVAPDPASRAIAASAGLPVFATVGEFEASIAPPPAPPPPVDESGGSGSGPGAGPGLGAAAVAGTAIAAGGSAVVDAAGTPGAVTAGDLAGTVEPGAPASGTSSGARSAGRGGRGRGKAAPAAAAGAAGFGGAAPSPDAETVATPVGPEPTGAAGVAQPATTVAVQPAETPTGAVQPAEAPTAAGLPAAAPAAPEPRARSSAATLPVVPSARVRRGVSRWVVAALIALGLLAAVAVAGYLVLPSATVDLTLSPVPIRSIDFVVRADPDATSVDAAGGVVPATRLSHDFTATGEFKATGKRVVQSNAEGTLRWTNCDPTRAHSIASGSIARTSGGIGFATNESVFLPVATLTGPVSNPTLTCQSRDVGATAVKAGPEGNVAAGAVKNVPGNQNAVVIKVTNPAAMAGGKREEFTRVSAKDVTAALASLTRDLQGQFTAWVAAPDELPSGSTTFPATGKLGAVTPSVDPATLVDVEEPTFQLDASATGTVVAVDATLVEQVATERISGSVPADHRLVPGSVTVTTEPGQADGDIVDFRVKAGASAIPVLDVAALREAIRGKPVAEARQILERYGTVSIETWPDFVTTIPTLDGRLDLTVTGDGGGVPSPEPSGP